jgi:hypothetical protein
MCVESVVKMRTTLRALAAETGHEMHDIIPTDRQFDVLDDLLKPLMLIKETSERLSADKPSLHIVLLALFNILTLSLEEDFNTSTDSRKAFVLTFEKEFLKRLPNYGRSVREFCIGNFLNPRFKGTLLKATVGGSQAEYDQTVTYIKDLFRSASQETQDFDSPSMLNEAFIDTERGWARTPRCLSEVLPEAEGRLTPIEKEIDTYLTVLPKSTRVDLDILDYWKNQEKLLPLLAKVARTYCGLPVSSASSERMFSTAGNVITSGRTLLNTEKAEQLIYIHDNYWLVSPVIKKWKLKTDRESTKEKEQKQKEKEKRAKERQRQEDSDSEPEEVVDEPQAGTKFK